MTAPTESKRTGTSLGKNARFIVRSMAREGLLLAMMTYNMKAKGGLNENQESRAER